MYICHGFTISKSEYRNVGIVFYSYYSAAHDGNMMDFRLEASLDLKAENERLQQKVMEHRNRFPAEASSSKHSPPSQSSSMYVTSSLHSGRDTTSIPVAGPISHNSSDSSGAFSSAAMISESFSDTTTSNGTDGIEFGKPSLYTPVGSNLEDQIDEGSKKKKVSDLVTAEDAILTSYYS